MRKSSKKISMLMVLAMLVSLFSGIVSASAASKWSFYDRTADEVVEVKDTYVMEKNQYANFDLYCEGEEADADTYSYYWESSNPDVVFVDKTNGRLRADKYGKAEAGDKAMISVYIDNKTTKKNENAKRSFYIQIAEDEVEDVEYAVTTKIGDAVLGTEALEAGKDYALTSTVTADGKAVEAVVTYTLDGAAIDKLNVKEGEYTVVVTATIDDAVVATEKYEIVAVGADFAAKATGVKAITVYGNFAKDAKFTVKKGAQNVSFTAAVAEDGKSAKLTLANKLTKGVYTVACGTATAEIAAEDEKVDAIIILENGGQILTDNTKKKAYVHYDVLNQYGESVRRAFDPSWNSTADSYIVDRNNGIITLTKTAGFDYNDMVVLTGVVTGYGFAKSETATMTIGLERNIDSVEVLGIVKGESTEIIDGIPASYIGAPYYLVFATYDNAGNLIEFNETQAESDLKFISMNPLLATFENSVDVETIYIDGVAYGRVKVVKPSVDTQLKKGGVVEVSITSTKTGNSTPCNVRIVSEQILDSFKVFVPDSLCIRNTVKDEASTYYLGFEALDTKGEKITDFRALYKAVQFSDNSVKLSENNDGTATLSYTVNKASIGSTDGFDALGVFSVTVLTSGKNEQVRLNIKSDRYAASVAGLAIQSNSEYIVEGNSIGLDLIGNSWSGKALCVQFADQYDAILEAKNSNLFRKGQYLGVKPLEAGVVTVGGTSVATLEDGTVIYDILAGPAITLTAEEIPVSKKAAVVEFAIYDFESGEYKLVGGSDKKYTFYVVDIDQCVEFTVNRTSRDGRPLYDYNNDGHVANFSVSAKLANGKSVALQNMTDNYYINYAANGKDVFENVASATTGAAISVDPTLLVDAKIFNDYSKPTAKEGEYEARNHKIDVTATVYGADNNVKGSASTSIEVSNRYAYDVSLSFTPSWARSWKLSLAGDNLTGYVKADYGVITKALLKEVFNGVVNYYGDTVAADINLTITKLVESENGLNPNGENLALGTGDNALVNAEIGDTFVATYTKGGLSHTIKFTVGSDTNAYFQGSNTTTATWR